MFFDPMYFLFESYRDVACRRPWLVVGSAGAGVSRRGN